MATPIEPVVNLFNKDTNVEIDNTTNIIDFGEVKAGDKSPVITLQLWNNKGGDQIASTMRDTELFILDKNEAKTEPIVTDGWLHVKCNSGGDVAFSRLNDVNTKKLTAAGLTEGEIEGIINDGVDANSTTNFAEFEVYAQIIDNVLSATHGEKPFYLAVRYYFT